MDTHGRAHHVRGHAFIGPGDQASCEEAEVAAGQTFDSFVRRQSFKFGITGAVDPRGEKPPVLMRNVDNNDVRSAIAKVGGKVERCDVTFTVGADGSPKDIATNCKPPALDPLIAEVVVKMQYTPARKNGHPADWPGIAMPMFFVEIGG